MAKPANLDKKNNNKKRQLQVNHQSVHSPISPINIKLTTKLNEN